MPNPEDADRIEQVVRRTEARNQAIAAEIENQSVLGTSYEVWAERLGTGELRSRTGGAFDLTKGEARTRADEYNEHEAVNAETDGRPVTVRYIVVKMTPTYEVEDD